MSAITVTTPFPIFSDLDGTPLESGYVYVGTSGLNAESNPITVYWDSDLTIPALQPIRTIGGYISRNGSPGQLYADAVDYSLLVKNKREALVWSTLKTSGIAPNADGIVYTPAGVGAVATTVQAELNNRRVSFFRWLTPAQIADVQTSTWYTGDVTAKRAAMYTSLVAAELHMRTEKVSIEFPDGWYEIGNENMPWRNTGAGLLDYYGAALFCSSSVTFATVSPNGADVFQLNAVKNLGIYGFPKLTGKLGVGATSGTNGVSVTNGWDNLDIEIFGDQLPRVDATSFIDGSKALTLQNGATTNPCGRLHAVVIADGCAEGFGFEPNLVTSLTKYTSVDVVVHARNCYAGFKFVAGEASSALTTSMASGVVVRGSAADCQHGAVIQRAHGLSADLEIISSGKTAAAKRLNPTGDYWLAADLIVEGSTINYVKNGNIRLHGNVGQCDYKLRLGGASAGLSGLNGATEFSHIDVDLGGAASIVDLLSIDAGGNSVKNTTITVSGNTSTNLPSDWTIISNNNNCRLGSIYKGSYAGALTGCTTTPSGDINYSVNGDVVTLEIPAITGTSNTTGATITNMPQSLWPTTTQYVIGICTDNSANAISRILVLNTGVLILNYGLSSAFTASGAKGVQYCTVTYRRS